MPMAQWDPFMYWTIAEGGAEFGSAMPAFKDALPKDDIWAVIATYRHSFHKNQNNHETRAHSSSGALVGAS
jgi:mono/diheme cytochrome c family protein